MAGRDNWFENLAKEAEASERAQEARERAERLKRYEEAAERTEIERLARLARATPPPRPGEARIAASIFEEVASGAAPPLGSGPNPWGGISGGIYTSGGVTGSMRPPKPEPAKPTPTQGLDAIIEEIAKAGDADAVFKAGGDWITRITNAITDVIKQADDS